MMGVGNAGRREGENAGFSGVPSDCSMKMTCFGNHEPVLPASTARTRCPTWREGSERDGFDGGADQIWHPASYVYCIITSFASASELMTALP